MESAYVAWQLYADHLRSRGDISAAQLWQKRAEDSRKADLFHWFVGRVDWYVLLALGSGVGFILFFVLLWIRYAPQRAMDYAKSMKPSPFGYLIRFASFPYWSGRERWTVATIGFICWYSIGLTSVFMAGGENLFNSSMNAWMGNIGVPQAVQKVEGYPATSARNFLLALGFQQNGENQKALRIYLGQPQYAEAWNNLGVIYRQNGDEAKARDAFENALRVNPDLQVAKLNLGQPTSGKDFFVEQHRQLFLGRPMLATPNPEQIHEALMGARGATPFFYALAGPFVNGSILDFAPTTVPMVLALSLILVIALAVIFVIPHYEVSQAPPRWLDWIELFVPGSSRHWGWLTSPALVLWGAVLWGAFNMSRLSTPFIFAGLTTPNIIHAYKAPGTIQDVHRLLLPHWSILYGLPIALFVINAVLVLRGRFSGRSMPPDSQARSAASSSAGPRG
jgi:tetratricopeptide (TPR) repeat protein